MMEPFSEKGNCLNTRELAWMMPLIIVLGLMIGVLSAISRVWALAAVLMILAILLVVYGFFKDGRLSFRRLTSCLLLAAILLPPIRLPAGLPAIRVETIVILVAWILFILGHLATGQPLRFHRTSVHRWFILFGLSMALTTAYAAVVNGYMPIGRDYWEFVKLLQYFLIFAMVSSLQISRADMRRYYTIALILFLSAALFGFAQYLSLGDINAVFSPYYAPTQMRGILVQGRITGTTCNPNEFGALMVLATSVALSGALFVRSRMLALFSWFCSAVFVLAIIFTLSRSALIALAVAVSFIFLFKWPRTVGVRRSICRLLVILPLLVVIGSVVVQLAPDKFFFRIEQLGDITNATSWQGRLAKWQDSLELWKQSPLFGWGPGKATMETTVDNEWLLLLRRYGLIGIVVFISWFGSFYFGLTRILRASVVPEMEALTIALQATLVAYAVYMIPAAIYHALQLMPILLILLGLAYSKSRAKPSLLAGEQQA